MTKSRTLLLVGLLAGGSALGGCGSDRSCSVVDNGDGTSTITCDDGTSAVVGGDESCTVADNGDGTSTITCDDGTSAVVGGDASCTVGDNGDGTSTITCDDGTSAVVGGDESCTIADNGDGTSTITCDDGTEVTVGGDESCTIADNGDGTSTITCDDGTEVTVGGDESCTVGDNGGGSSVVSCDDGTRLTIATGAVVLFETPADMPNGALGDRVATTRICEDAAVAAGLVCPRGARAFIAYSGFDDLASMPSVHGVPAYKPVESISGAPIANDWADLFDGDGIVTSLVDAGVTGPTLGFSGAAPDGTASANCNNWSSSSPRDQATAFFPSTTASSWISHPDDTLSCSVSRRMLCVCY